MTITTLPSSSSSSLTALHLLRTRLFGPSSPLARTSQLALRQLKLVNNNNNNNSNNTLPASSASLDSSLLPLPHRPLKSYHRRRALLPLLPRAPDLLHWYPPDINVTAMAKLDHRLVNLDLKNVWLETRLKKEVDKEARGKRVRVSGKEQSV